MPAASGANVQNIRVSERAVDAAAAGKTFGTFWTFAPDAAGNALSEACDYGTPVCRKIIPTDSLYVYGQAKCCDA